MTVKQICRVISAACFVSLVTSDRMLIIIIWNVSESFNLITLIYWLSDFVKDLTYFPYTLTWHPWVTLDQNNNTYRKLSSHCILEGSVSISTVYGQFSCLKQFWIACNHCVVWAFLKLYFHLHEWLHMKGITIRDDKHYNHHVFAMHAPISLYYGIN